MPLTPALHDCPTRLPTLLPLGLLMNGLSTAYNVSNHEIAHRITPIEVAAMRETLIRQAECHKQ
jgi:hypothetical protein